MKRILGILCACIFSTGLCYAQTPAASSTMPKAPAAVPASKAVETPKTPAVKVLMGKVESVSMADPAKGTKSEIVIMDENAKKSTVLVKSSTTLYDEAWKPMTLDKIKAGDKIKIKYEITPEGMEEAVSVHLSK